MWNFPSKEWVVFPGACCGAIEGGGLQVGEDWGVSGVLRGGGLTSERDYGCGVLVAGCAGLRAFVLGGLLLRITT